MNSTKAITYLTVLFLAGALAGAFIGFNMGKRSVAQVAVVPPTPRPNWGSNDFPRPTGQGWGPRPSTIERLRRELELSDAQVEKVEPIIKAFDTQLETMSKQNWENLALAVSNRNERIKPFLTEDQLKKLEERSKRRGPGDRGPGNPGEPRSHQRRGPDAPPKTD